MKKPILYIAMLAFTLTACVNLKHVNDFASSSEKSLGDFKNIPYSWEQYCIDKCNLDTEKAIASGLIKFRPSLDVTCNCTTEAKIDKDVANAYNLLIIYFTGLEKLSNDKNYVYKTDSLTTALTAAGAISDTSLKKPINSIATILLNWATTAYREHALEKILGDAQAPVNQLLLDLEGLNTNVKLNYKTYYERFVRVLITKYAGASPVAADVQLNDYIANKAMRDELKLVSKKIDDFNAALEKIRAGHQKLAAERMSLKDKDLIKYLYTQANAIKTNISKL